MAVYQWSPPDKFTFRKPEEWVRWIRRFERFRQASGLAGKSEENQVNALVYAMGEEADDILRSFHLSTEDAKKYETVKQGFQKYFIKKRNVIYERTKFNLRVQRPDKSVDSFITDLHSLAEFCEYGDLRDELIRDRIVVGLRDKKLSEKLQMDYELTLEKAVTCARQTEAIKQQQTTLNSQLETTNSIEVIKRTGFPQKRKQDHRPQQRAITGCTRCGKSPMHSKAQCPAKDATCKKCHKKGHFQAVCWSKVTNSAVAEIEQEEDAFIGPISSTDLSEPRTATLNLNKCPLKFKIDTGADVTAVPEMVYDKVRDGPLQKSNRVLRGPSKQILKVKGFIVAKLAVDHRETEEKLYIVNGLQQPLVGRPAIQSLNLVSRIEVVQTSSEQERIIHKFPELFTGLGSMEGKYHIKLKSNATPFVLTTPRRIAIPLQPKVKAELQRMEKMGVIRKVQEPTEWCSGIVVVPKPNGQVRICVDLTKLNESVCRERHILPSVEETLAQLGNAKVFSKLDANSGFWQVKLDQSSSLLTTFITPFGRYCFDRLPFGITSAPEYFQKTMTTILEGVEGAVCLMDDILIYGRDPEEHYQRLEIVLSKLKAAGVTLNSEKCQFAKQSIKFLGHIISQQGIKPDPTKIRAITEMSPPNNVSAVRRFMGMVNQLGKFCPKLAEKARPLHDLLSSKNEWNWGDGQQKSFDEIKQDLASTPVLALFDPQKETTISADASSYGLGAVIAQKQPTGEYRPIAYISRVLTSAEQQYAQIEKEALAVTWACERLSNYLIGMQFHIFTDHKPLVPLMGQKNLDELPLRVQRFRMRLMRFKYTISHVPGKSLVVADMLSRAPTDSVTAEDEKLTQETDIYVNMVMNNLPATDKRLVEIKEAQDSDTTCSKVKQYCKEGWPTKVNGELKKYQAVAGELTVHNNLLMKGSRLVIPNSLRQEMLEKLHSGHQGVTKCRQRAKSVVWWPRVSKELEEFVTNCHACAQHRFQPAEPLIPSVLPEHPWQRIASDLFEWKQHSYLLIVDYYSRFIEVTKLTTTSAEEVIRQCKSIFARYGIPAEMITDNGPQFSAKLFTDFAKSYGFSHKTSSPRFPQSNGEAERAVQTIKRILTKNDDPYIGLLAYRSTPLENGYSPAELLMGRKLRTTVPIETNQLKPQLPKTHRLKKKERQIRNRQKQNFDHHHKARSLSPLREGDRVWLPDGSPGQISQQSTFPRSYDVQTETGAILRQNRRHLIQQPTQQIQAERPSTEVSPEDDNRHLTCDSSRADQTTTRSGRVSRPPKRFIEESN